MSKIRYVITAFGRVESRRKCRWIKGKYYLENIECVRVKNQWHRIDNGKVGFHIPNQKWILLEDMPSNFREVLISINPKTKYPNYGWRPIDKFDDVKVERLNHSSIINGLQSQLDYGFMPDVYRQILTDSNSDPVKQLFENVKDKTFDKFYQDLVRQVKEMSVLLMSDHFFNYTTLANEEDIKDTHFEIPSSGVFFEKKYLPPSVIRSAKSNSNVYPLSQYSLEYSTVGNRQERFTNQRWKEYSKRLPSTPLTKELARCTGTLSFGIEYETSTGFIPERVLPGAGLIPLRDGSLDGGLEYTTIPMKGEEGIKSIFHQGDLLSKYTRINERCSLHIHLGGIPRTYDFIDRMYKLSIAIEEEMYALYPDYKKYGRKGASRSYCQPLRKLSTVEALFEYISGGNKMKKTKEIPLLSIREHPHGTSKWNRPGRYHWINFEPYFFGPGTIEFRMATPTKNSHKVICTLLLFAAMANCAMGNKAIPKTLKGVIENGLPSHKNTVLHYLEYRSNLRKKENMDKEINNDDEYSNPFLK